MHGSIQRSALCGFAGLLIALLFAGLYGPTGVGRSFIALTFALTILFGGGLHLLAVRYEAKLARRILTPADGHWDVVLNDIKLGVITDAEYATIQQGVFRDSRVAGAQILNLLHMFAQAVGRLVGLMPFVTFWAIIGLFVVAPDQAFVVLQAAEKADAKSLASGIYAGLSILFSFSASMLLLLTVTTRSLGFRDCYAEGVNREVRRHFNAVATGDVRMVRQGCGCSEQ